MKKLVYPVMASNAVVRPYSITGKDLDLSQYDSGYVEFRDGEPSFIYDTYRDAYDGVRYSKQGDIEYGEGQHEYDILYYEDGEFFDVGYRRKG